MEKEDITFTYNIYTTEYYSALNLMANKLEKSGKSDRFYFLFFYL